MFKSLPAYYRRNRFRIRWAEALGRPDCPYLVRWVLETPLGSLRLHHWLASDDGRHFHDHPWGFVTVVLAGQYQDVTPAGAEPVRPGRPYFRPAHHRHTVQVPRSGCWSLLLTGPHLRFWGFHVNGRFVKSNKYFLEHGHPPCHEGGPDESPR